jgi:hypothetical protein
MSALREELRAAIYAAFIADSTLRAAEAMADRAREFVRNIERSIEGFADVDARISSERADDIKAAFAEGREPSFDLSLELTKAIASRAEAENRLSAARQAAATLAGEHADAQAHERKAKQAVAAAVAAVAAQEAAVIAVEIDRLETAALALRARLGGGTSSMVALLPISEIVKRVLRASDKSDIAVRNMPAWHEAQAADAEWREFVKGLAVDGSAELGIA